MVVLPELDIDAGDGAIMNRKVLVGACPNRTFEKTQNCSILTTVLVSKALKAHVSVRFIFICFIGSPRKNNAWSSGLR